MIFCLLFLLGWGNRWVGFLFIYIRYGRAEVGGKGGELGGEGGELGVDGCQGDWVGDDSHRGRGAVEQHQSFTGH